VLCGDGRVARSSPSHTGTIGCRSSSRSRPPRTRRSPSPSYHGDGPPPACTSAEPVRGAQFSVRAAHRAPHWLPTVDHPYDKATGEPGGHGARPLPGRRQRAAQRGDRPAGAPDHAVRAIRSHRETWCSPWGWRTSRVEHTAPVRGVPLEVLGSSPGPRTRVPGLEPRPGPPSSSSATPGAISYQKLANVEAAGVRGGMEARLGTSSTASPTSPTPRSTTWWCSEICHQWFGDSVTRATGTRSVAGEALSRTLPASPHEHTAGSRRFRGRFLRHRARSWSGGALPDTPISTEPVSDPTKLAERLRSTRRPLGPHMLRQSASPRPLLERAQRVLPAATAMGTHQRGLPTRHGGRLRQDLRCSSASGSSGRAFQVEGSWRYDRASRTLRVELNSSDPRAVPGALDLGLLAEGRREACRDVDLRERSQRFELSLDESPAEWCSTRAPGP